MLTKHSFIYLAWTKRKLPKQHNFHSLKVIFCFLHMQDCLKNWISTEIILFVHLFNMSNSVEDPLITCPFNKTHIFTKSLLQKHIIKCSKNHPNHFVCPYNALHRFLEKDDHTRHLLACADMTFTMPWKYSKPTVHGNLNETPFHIDNSRKFNLELENWNAQYS